MAGRHCRMRSGLSAALFRPRSQVEEEKLTRRAAEERLSQVGLWESRTSWRATSPTAGSGCWRSRGPWPPAPGSIVLDEPSSGLNPRETEILMEFIRGIIRDEDLTVLLIEHDMNVVMGISDWVTVMDGGRKIAEGEPRQIYHNPRVIEAYLGVES